MPTRWVSHRTAPGRWGIAIAPAPWPLEGKCQAMLAWLTSLRISTTTVLFLAFGLLAFLFVVGMNWRRVGWIGRGSLLLGGAVLVLYEIHMVAWLWIVGALLILWPLGRGAGTSSTSRRKR